MLRTDIIFEFGAHSKAFLERAREHLTSLQSTSDLRHFFYAALDLRFGIEARVTEYLEAALKSLGRDPKDVNDYVASKLLRKLAEIDPLCETPETVRITSEQTGESSTFAYTPVTGSWRRYTGN